MLRKSRDEVDVGGAGGFVYLGLGGLAYVRPIVAHPLIGFE